ncbi:MAG: hypothetical protein HQK73_10705 [Desulfamplus sp.]|nr:hypothetical protein [Desulfamplus sp.]
MNKTYFIIGLIIIASITGCAENYNREFTEGYNDNYATYTEMPPIVFDEPPELIVVPETYVYVVPDLDDDLFFYSGWWWRPWKGDWYRSRHYNSGWRRYQNTPSFYRDIPSGWRNDYRNNRWRGDKWDYQRIPHRNAERNWSKWEKIRHWENQEKRHHNNSYERIDHNQVLNRRNEKSIKERDGNNRYERRYLEREHNNKRHERLYPEREHNNRTHERINSDRDRNKHHENLDQQERTRVQDLEPRTRDQEQKRQVEDLEPRIRDQEQTNRVEDLELRKKDFKQKQNEGFSGDIKQRHNEPRNQDVTPHDTDSNVENPEIPNHRRHIRTMENIDKQPEEVEVEKRNRLKLEDRP